MSAWCLEPLSNGGRPSQQAGRQSEPDRSQSQSQCQCQSTPCKVQTQSCGGVARSRHTIPAWQPSAAAFPDSHTEIPGCRLSHNQPDGKTETTCSCRAVWRGGKNSPEAMFRHRPKPEQSSPRACSNAVRAGAVQCSAVQAAPTILDGTPPVPLWEGQLPVGFCRVCRQGVPEGGVAVEVVDTGSCTVGSSSGGCVVRIQGVAQ